MSTAAPSVGRLFGSWTFDPLLCAGLLAAAAAYLLGMRRSRREWPWWRGALWLAGLAALALATMSGIDHYAELLLSVHMLQHLLVLLLAPVLLLSARLVGLALRGGSQCLLRRTGPV